MTKFLHFKHLFYMRLRLISYVRIFSSGTQSDCVYCFLYMSSFLEFTLGQGQMVGVDKDHIGHCWQLFNPAAVGKQS